MMSPELTTLTSSLNILVLALIMIPHVDSNPHILDQYRVKQQSTNPTISVVEEIDIHTPIAILPRDCKGVGRTMVVAPSESSDKFFTINFIKAEICFCHRNLRVPTYTSSFLYLPRKLLLLNMLAHSLLTPPAKSLVSPG
ncbi:uncharacterized protein MKZ38_010705 [Zalerion maritima]|uniref:Uncharacterized protein n=1 Tax=Zalerion maritima TaxID=339359 RepID=A0AAD5RSW4_9PEZI|nr:uncharacterized protein MKZ38_010705 [Zalerion maritima]